MSADNTIDPDETRDKAWDWANQLATGETIASAVVAIVDANGATATNATVDATNYTDTTVTARLSGASGTTVYARCRVTTSAGQILDDTWPLSVTQH